MQTRLANSRNSVRMLARNVIYARLVRRLEITCRSLANLAPFKIGSFEISLWDGFVRQIASDTAKEARFDAANRSWLLQYIRGS